MTSRLQRWLLLAAILVGACSKPQPPPAAAPAAAPAGGIGASPPSAAPAVAPAAASPAPAAPTPPLPVTAPAASAAPAPASGPAALASQETNWPGVVAEVIEFRRKGNIVTAKVRLRNGGPAERQPDVQYDQVYLLDAANAKKYQVLRDEKATYIAALSTGYANRWSEDLKPGESRVIWMTFPAPPADVATITLQLPSTPPFADLAIQNG